MYLLVSSDQFQVVDLSRRLRHLERREVKTSPPREQPRAKATPLPHEPRIKTKLEL